MDHTQRARFYEGQYLGAEDLSALVEYPRLQQARHDLGAHTWGIAVGLDIVERTLPSGEIENVILPGYAWDGFGRPIVVLAPAKITPDSMKNFQGTTPAEGLLVKVWLRYDEEETKPSRSGFQACGPDDQNERVIETFAIALGEPALGAHDPVVIDGTPVEPAEALSTFAASAPSLRDESVPFQAFPEDAKTRWLVPIGYVRWLKPLNQPGRFVPRIDAIDPKDSDLIREFRQYIGVVAETVNAVDGIIRLRDRKRTLDPTKTHVHVPRLDEDPTNPDDLVWIEGSLRVQGDTRLAAGQLEFRTKQGLDGDTPTVLRRRGDAGKDDDETGDRSLEAVIGKTGQDDSHFFVGPVGDENKLHVRFTVLSSGPVGVGNDAPVAQLQIKKRTSIDESDNGNWASFGSNARYDGSWSQIDPAVPGVNFHMAADADGEEFRFLRVEANDANRRNIAVIGSQSSWILGGHVGLGTTEPAAQLHLKTRTTIDEGTDADGLWSNIGQNSHFDGGWHRIDDKKPGVNVRMNPDADGREFRFSKTTAGGARTDIAVLGTETSYVADGRLGIGTDSPAARLDVAGRVLRHSKDFTFAGTADDGEFVKVPWGTTDDWHLFVSIAELGTEDFVGPFTEFLMGAIRCSAKAHSDKSGYTVTARFRSFASSMYVNGKANYILVPR